MASWLTLSLDPTGAVAMRGERHPITQAGMFFTVEELERGLRGDRAGIRVDQATDPACLIATQTQPSEHSAHRTEVCVDAKRSLPMSIQVWDDRGRLLERYTYSDYRVDLGLTDATFDTGNAEYHF